MKRNFLILVLMMIAVAASAQFNFGIKAGYNSTLSLQNLNTITNGDYNLDNLKTEFSKNYQVGIFTRFNFERFYIQPEVLYTVQQEEFEVKDVDAGDNSTMDIQTFMNVSTVDIPIFVGYKIIDSKAFNLRAYVGPKIALNAGSQLEYKNLSSGDFSLSELAQDFKTAQVDLEAGVGFDLFMFTIDAKLNLARDIVGKIQSNDDLSKVTMPTSTFVISLGWKIF